MSVLIIGGLYVPKPGFFSDNIFLNSFSLLSPTTLSFFFTPLDNVGVFKCTTSTNLEFLFKSPTMIYAS